MSNVFQPAGSAPLHSPDKSLADQPFFARYAIWVSLFILASFAQFSLRGLVDIRHMPLLIHVHAAAMVAWLGVFVVQNHLINRGLFHWHRKLGWLATGLVVAIAWLGCAAGFKAIALHIVPPFFPPAYFLALTLIEALAFAAVIAWAIALRRYPDWHRRLMFGATFVVLEPALGRLLPMPLLGASGEWLVLLAQLMFVLIVARHDRRTLGRIHPATAASAAVLVAVHVAVSCLALLPWAVALAARIAAA